MHDGTMPSLDPSSPSRSEPDRWTASSIYPDMWVDPDRDPREAVPEPVDERTTLLAYLSAYRLTLEMKCADLDAEQLASRSVPPSTMSLLGLVRHMADVTPATAATPICSVSG